MFFDKSIKLIIEIKKRKLVADPLKFHITKFLCGEWKEIGKNLC